MVPAPVSTTFDVFSNQVRAPLPSPADSLSSPTLNRTLNDTHAYLGQLTPRDELLEAAAVLPQPYEPSIPAMMSPPAEGSPNPDMDTIVGGALAPVHTSPPSRPLPKTQNDLRLPSFEALGIASPHPDRYGGSNVAVDGAFVHASRDIMQGPLSGPQGRSQRMNTFQSMDIGRMPRDSFDHLGKRALASAFQAPVRHYVNTITPPAEVGEIHWSSTATVRSAPMDSPSTEPEAHVRRSNEVVTRAPVVIVDPASEGTSRSGSSAGRRAWIAGATATLIDNLQSTPIPSTSLKILSHALPSPSPTGHIFSSVIKAIQGSTPSTPTSDMTWINVFHAIPGRFNLEDLPRSPPATPGPPVSGAREDYFTEKIFDSAVSISDYQEDLSQLPRSPRPVVPPSSIDVSIVERYIPPSSQNEFAEMFDLNGPSILVDRLVELSPNNGSLLFIYPTKLGAQTFMREYLGPILDPMLRKMVVVYGLSSDLSRTLGSMNAVAQLLDHDSLRHRVASLCARLTQRSSAIRRFQGRQPKFTLSYSTKQYVHLEREVWCRDWWAKQEKQRVRETITRFYQEAHGRRRVSEHVDEPPASLVQQFLKELVERPYEHGHEPESGIEVSVFVIKRSE